MSDEQAQKVDPQYVGGAPVKVAYASNQVEAELIQGILLEEGIPSSQRRARGFDVPDFLAAGPRDILVPEAAYEAARSLIYESPALGRPRQGPFEPEGERPARLLAGLLIALGAAAAIVYGLSRLVA